MTTRIYLIRHGETLWNTEYRLQGQLDSPITDLGRRQAEASAGRVRDINPDLLISSDLGRAAETARILADGRAVPTRLDPAFREKAFGIFEGKTWEEVERDYPEEFAAFVASPGTYAPPGGESAETAQKRIFVGLDGAVKECPGGTILIVSHGGTISQILRSVLHIPHEAPRAFTIGNLGIHVISHRDDRYRVESMGDTAHLRGVVRDELEAIRT